MENMISMPITTRMEIIIGIQVCFNSRMNFDYKENGGKKAFLTNRSINNVYPNVESFITVPITKKMEIIMCIHVCPISWMNLHYTRNGEKKAFLANPKHQYRVAQ